MADIVALGEILIDFMQTAVSDDGYPTIKAQPGGAPANFLTARKKYGRSCAMIGKVGRDAFGNLLKDTLTRAGINGENVIVDPNYFTTLAFVTLKDGERSFSFARKPGADTGIRFDEVDKSLIENCKIFHFGTLSFTHPTARETTINCLELAKKNGKLISFDPNLRPALWEHENLAKEAMLFGLNYADIVKISDEEVKFLFNCDEKCGADKILNIYNCKLVYVTMGAKGCYRRNKNGSCYVSAPENITAVDTTGAGDIFGGSRAAMLLNSGKNPEDLTVTELKNICEFATLRASLSTLKNGGIQSVPNREEIQKYINNK